VEKSNIIISIIIVICIAAGVTAYGLTSEDNGVFKNLQGIGADNGGSGVGNSTNVSTNTDNSGSGSSDNSGSDGQYSGGDSSGTGYYDGSGSDDSGNNAFTPNDNGGSNDNGGLNNGDPTVVAYTLTTYHSDGSYTVTRYNYLDQAIGYITYDKNGNQIEGAGGAPSTAY
jgi:hypothetical protein